MKEIPAYVLIKIFGIEDMVKKVPPILTNIAWVRIYGEGLIFKIRETVIVRGISMITVSMLFKIAEISIVIKQNILIKYTGFPLESFIKLKAKN